MFKILQKWLRKSKKDTASGPASTVKIAKPASESRHGIDQLMVDIKGEALSMKDEDGVVATKAYYLLRKKPSLSPEDLVKKNILLPDKPGIYAWYARKLPPVLSPFASLEVEGWHLLYVGIAVHQSLQSRVVGKHLGKTGGSTLRFSIASLLYTEGKLKDEAFVTNRLAAEGEQQITQWMKDNMALHCLVYDKPHLIEQYLIRKCGNYLFFNLQSNAANPFYRKLKGMRSSLKNRIALPVDDNFDGEES